VLTASRIVERLTLKDEANLRWDGSRPPALNSPDFNCPRMISTTDATVVLFIDFLETPAGTMETDLPAA
jgi:hypothetical protein